MLMLRCARDLTFKLTTNMAARGLLRKTLFPLSELFCDIAYFFEIIYPSSSFKLQKPLFWNVDENCNVDAAIDCAGYQSFAGFTEQRTAFTHAQSAKLRFWFAKNSLWYLKYWYGDPPILIQQQKGKSLRNCKRNCVVEFFQSRNFQFFLTLENLLHSFISHFPCCFFCL